MTNTYTITFLNFDDPNPETGRPFTVVSLGENPGRTGQEAIEARLRKDCGDLADGMTRIGRNRVALAGITFEARKVHSS